MSRMDGPIPRNVQKRKGGIMMKKYRVNSDMLGDATQEDAMRMVELLLELGYDVEYTSMGGCIVDPYFDGEEPSERDWEACLAKICEENREKEDDDEGEQYD